jgi:hypothetical protein
MDRPWRAESRSGWRTPRAGAARRSRSLHLAAGDTSVADARPQDAGSNAQARNELAQALGSARAALRGGRKADLAVALDALVKATYQVVVALDGRAPVVLPMDIDEQRTDADRPRPSRPG